MWSSLFIIAMQTQGNSSFSSCTIIGCPFTYGSAYSFLSVCNTLIVSWEFLLVGDKLGFPGEVFANPPSDASGMS